MLALSLQTFLHDIKNTTKDFAKTLRSGQNRTCTTTVSGVPIASPRLRYTCARCPELLSDPESVRNAMKSRSVALRVLTRLI